MKSRIFLVLAAVFSIGLAQAAAHDQQVQIDQAARRSRENKEFAIGVTIGLFGPAAAGKVGIPFGDMIAEAAIRGSIIAELPQTSITEILLCIASIASSITIIDAGLPHEESGLAYITNSGASICLAFGSSLIQNYLINRQRHPLTRNTGKGIILGSQLRTMRTLLSAEQPHGVASALVSVGVLSSLALACKTAYNFWHR